MINILFLIFPIMINILLFMLPIMVMILFLKTINYIIYDQTFDDLVSYACDNDSPYHRNFSWKCFFGFHKFKLFKDQRICIRCGQKQEKYKCGASDTITWRNISRFFNN